MLRDRTAIAGIGQTEFGKSVEGSEKALACRAILAALDDAGIAPGEVDGLASYTMETTDEVDVARTIGLGDLSFFTQVGYGGGAGCGVVG
ncbi:MAG: lipid-transfer protein, partial [Actinobacteria bacterium]|nr:lipid-transfer protein [Actinomycetota bacterium]